MTALVWYAAYGSNMSRARFDAYLRGGRPQGAQRTYPGARNPSPPVADEALWLPGRVYFALESKVWGGGMAFYDRDAEGETPGRAYLLTVGQFSDVAEQEMHRAPSSDLAVADAVAAGEHRYGPGRYETLVCVGERLGHPVLTLTAPWRMGDMPFNAPSLPYLRMLASGLMEAHGWDAGRAAAHLVSLPGAAGAVSAVEVERAVSAVPAV
jgi:hypothetical protein